MAEQTIRSDVTAEVFPDIVTTAGVFYLAHLTGTYLLLVWQHILGRLLAHWITPPWAFTLLMTFVPMYVLAVVAGVVLFRLLRSVQRVPYTLLLAVLFVWAGTRSLSSQAQFVLARALVLVVLFASPWVGAFIAAGRRTTRSGA